MSGADDVKERASRIGQICISWAALEGVIAHTIWFLLEVDEGTGKIVTGGLNIFPSLNMAINLARKRKTGQQFVRSLQGVRKAIQDGLDARRNLAVHGINLLKEDKWLVEMHRRGAPPQPLPVADLRALALEINDQFEAVSTATDTLAAKWKGPLRTRHERSSQEAFKAGFRAGWRTLRDHMLKNILSDASDAVSTPDSAS